jgi:molecular chaperone GrpE
MTKRATTKGKEEEKTFSGESFEKEAAVEREKKEQSDLEKELEQMKREAADNYDKYLRAAAEMENYKKRAAREKADAINYGNETLIRDILPIVDRLERALDHSSNSKDFDSFVEGLNLIYDKLLGVLEKNGVEKIDAVGKDFDPHFHEAVLQVKSADVDDNKVVEKFENGYLLNDRLLRPVKVSVSKHVTNERKTS